MNQQQIIEILRGEMHAKVEDPTVVYQKMRDLLCSIEPSFAAVFTGAVMILEETWGRFQGDPQKLVELAEKAVAQGPFKDWLFGNNDDDQGDDQ